MRGNGRSYERLRVELFARRISTAEVARIIGVVPQTVKEKLDGIRDFYCGEAEKISKAFGIPISFFYEERCLKETEANTEAQA